MSEGNNTANKGFAGLDALVSRVDKPQVSRPATPARQAATGSAVSRPTLPAALWRQSGRTKADTATRWFWGIATSVVLVTTCVAILDQSERTRTPPPPAKHTGHQAAPASDYSQRSQATNNFGRSSREEERPPKGSSLVLSPAQIRYCLSESVRLSSWEQMVNQYSQSSVDAYNNAVNDYNARCSRFRYRSGTLEGIRAEVEGNRYLLEAEGQLRALGN